ncbi:MAG TPA: PQQ-binding-like beta-propeller repeat protein [Pirellulales bacterium]|jgi:outer membrane protein assembly factor BamB|nr:PQQ-binding-like beta-propeller repeat protein [Pirellulales bacterium]
MTNPRRIACWICCGLLCGVVLAGCGQSRAEPQARSEPLAARPKTPLKSAESWPRWRGPGGQGIAGPTRLPEAWPDEDVAPFWRAELGTGWSSPVVAQGKVVITDRQEKQERTLAFEADTGKLLWERSHSVDFNPHEVGLRHGNGPKSTPLIDHGRVYSLGIAGWLECLDLKSGEVLWQINLPERFGTHQRLPGGRAYVNGVENVIVPIGAGEGAPVPLFGYTGSPTLFEDLLVLSVGGERGGTIMAFRAATGEVAWQALDENVSYSSPIVASVAGRPQVVVMTGPHVVGIDPHDGRVLWRHPFQIQYDESIGTPVAAGNFVIVTATGRPLTALRITAAGDACNATVAWENDDLTSYLSSMVIYDGHVYGMNDGGEFACISLTEGKTVWIDGNHGYYCTPVLADSRLLGLNERGDLLVVAASPAGYRELGQSRLADDATWTSPAVTGSRIYIRSKQGLRAFDLGR